MEVLKLKTHISFILYKIATKVQEIKIIFKNSGCWSLPLT